MSLPLTDRQTGQKKNLTDCPKNNERHGVVKFAEAFSLISTAFLSSRRQSSIDGRFSCFIGGAVVNVPGFGRPSSDANSSGGVVGPKLPPRTKQMDLLTCWPDRLLLSSNDPSIYIE
jgi:hypothetical protein